VGPNESLDLELTDVRCGIIQHGHQGVTPGPWLFAKGPLLQCVSPRDTLQSSSPMGLHPTPLPSLPPKTTTWALGGEGTGYPCAAQHSAMEPIHAGHDAQTCREPDQKGAGESGARVHCCAPGPKPTHAVKAGHETGQQQRRGRQSLRSTQGMAREGTKTEPSAVKAGHE
jgi:hypothetical protein